jgi:hypothetical protein
MGNNSVALVFFLQLKTTADVAMPVIGHAMARVMPDGPGAACPEHDGPRRS